jgi:diguanylate cyclase
VRYQPKVSLQGQDPTSIVGAEALVGCLHPQRGVLFADRFLPIAEQFGLIDELSRWVVGEVIQRLRQWENSGRQLTVAVNLPASLLASPDFLNCVEQKLLDAGVPAERLMFEITERVGIQYKPIVMDALSRLRSKGMGLSMDDFGVGYPTSSLPI